MILIQATTILLALTGARTTTDSVAVARRIAASAQLAAQEYRIGVANGKVIAPAEVEEAKLFLTEAKQTARLLPASVSVTVDAELGQLLAMVGRVGAPDSVDLGVRQMTDGLAEALQVTLVDIPERTPSLARGSELYARECRACHGNAGLGNGAAGRSLTPPPTNLANYEALHGVSPLAFYQRVTIGVAGTAMPSFETRLSAEDRWAVALYAATLRQARPSGEVPVALRAFPATAQLSDDEVLAELGPTATREQLAAVRSFQPVADDAAATATLFTTVRGKVSEAGDLAVAGRHQEAVSAAFDAYLAFEKVERTVRAKRPELATKLEASFATLRTRVAGGATAAELDGVQRELAGGLEQAERVVGDTLSPANLFLQSLVIMLREGLEAILIIGALMAFLVKTGAGHRKRDIHIGVGAAVVLSLLTALLLETVFVLSPAHRESMEGFTMVAAVVVLFYVSYWLLSKMEVAKWTQFVKERVQVAVTGGSAFALASAAFLAVYREGFETVLFYKALYVSGGEVGGTFWPVTLGILVGSVALAIVYVAINKWGVKLPLKPFFAVTSGFLYYTAFVFAGKAIAELQAGGAVPTTILLGWPRWPALGIYPTLESMLAQGLLAALALAAIGYLFLVQRPADTRVLAAAPGAPLAAPVVLSAVMEGPGREMAMLRSLERMEGDLAALRAEVERLKDAVVEASAEDVAQQR
ncbi:MAG: FTR1 family protein [Gemmatimonadota bacterium]